MLDTGDGRIRLEVDAPIATITLVRAGKLNALDMEMMLALERAAHLIETQPGVRVAIITGEGEKSFCAGGDIEAWSKLDPITFGQIWIRHGHRTLDAVARLRQPLIAALNGHTLGGGIELAATADFRIAEEHVKVGCPETGIGIIPGWSGTQRLVRRFGSQVVRRMAIAGEIYSATEAKALGLVDEVVPRGASLATAREYAARILSRGPAAIELVKALVNAAEGEEFERPIEAIAGAFAATTSDLNEGVASFKEKRKPQFGPR
jgi:enoyl-CoA hydratase/carnithine racemase